MEGVQCRFTQTEGRDKLSLVCRCERHDRLNAGGLATESGKGKELIGRCENMRSWLQSQKSLAAILRPRSYIVRQPCARFVRITMMVLHHTEEGVSRLSIAVFVITGPLDAVANQLRLRELASSKRIGQRRERFCSTFLGLRDPG